MLRISGLGRFNPASDLPTVPGGGGGTSQADPIPIVVGRNRLELDRLMERFRSTLRSRRNSVAAALVATGQLKPCAEIIGARAGITCQIEAGQRENLRILDPIGVIVEMGVPFMPDELKAGYLERDFTPSDEQRFWLDMIVYAASQRSLVAGELPWPGTEAYGKKIWPEIADSTGKLQRIIDSVDWSVNETIDRFRIKGSASDPRDGEPVFTYDLPGFSLNPIRPTDAELTGKGGLRDYYRRGGFLLDRQISNGRRPAAQTHITWTTGYCTCTDGVTPMATFDQATGEGFGWESYITIGEPSYRLRVRPRDAPWWSEAASFAANKLKALMGFICSNKGMIQQLNTSVVGKELCHDVAGQPCEKGKKGCYCTPPTGSQQAAIALANAGLSVWCAAPWMPPPKEETPLNPPPPPPPETPSKAPLWLVGLGSAIVGGIVAAFAGRR